MKTYQQALGKTSERLNTACSFTLSQPSSAEWIPDVLTIPYAGNAILGSCIPKHLEGSSLGKNRTETEQEQKYCRTFKTNTFPPLHWKRSPCIVLQMVERLEAVQKHNTYVSAFGGFNKTHFSLQQPWV